MPDFDTFNPNTWPLQGLIVIEAKTKNPSINMSTANKIPKDGTSVIQMSDDWITQTADKLIELGGNQKKLGDLIIRGQKEKKLSKAVVAVDKATGEIIVQKLN